MAFDKTKKLIQYAPTDDDGIYYPESDGKPLAETDLHRVVIVNTYQKLEGHFEDRDDVYVSGNLLIYDVPGKTRRSISPDVMVVFGIEKKMRRTYKIWEEGKAPDFVMEVTSKSTYKNDLRKKKTRYAHIGVQEYFLYDPERSYLSDSLIGFQLNEDEKYDEIPGLPNGGIPSAVLGIEFSIQGDDIGLYVPTSEQWLQTPAERVQQEAQARQQEAQARQQAEAEVARLKAEIEQLKGLQNEHEN